MNLFGRPIRSGTYRHRVDGMDVEYRVNAIAGGYKVTGTVRGRLGRLEILRAPAESAHLVNNWQSWGPMCWLNQGERYPGADFMLERGNSALFTPVPDLFSRLPVSDYFLAAEDILFGFLSSRIGHPFFTIDQGEIVASCEYGNLTTETPLPLESLIILRGTGTANRLEQYGALVGEENPLPPVAHNPVGWCSWYQYFNTVTWDDILHNLRLAGGRFPFQVFQIDDGYQQDVGDWTERRDGWPDLATMAQTIRDHGFVPGIWTAPFMVSGTSRLFHDHPDWALGHPDPPSAFGGWGKPIYPLDTSNPEVQKWLHSLFSSLRGAGFRYFKIDFLYAGAMPGQRTRSVTPTQAYRLGLRSIREAVGNDFVLGCGAPLLPSVGYVNGMRVGEDTAPFWDSSLSPFHGPNAYHALKNPLLRQFMHRRFWLNDPDCILLRESDIRLRKAERELYAQVAGALDTMIVESDNLALVDDEGFRLLKKALSLRGGQASSVHHRDLDLFEITTRGGPAGSVRLLANLSDQRVDWGERSVEPRSVVEIPAGAGPDTPA